MEVYREDNRFCIEAQGIYASFPDTPGNRKAVIVLLRWLRHSRGGRPLFTLEELAQIVGSSNRQAASEYAEQFRACGEDFEPFLRRQCKVDEEVVEAVFAEVERDPLASVSCLQGRVQSRLGRDDLSEGNIRTALDQISLLRMRPVLKRLLVEGQTGVCYQEAALIEDLLAHIDGQGEFKAGLACQHKAPDRILSDPTSIRKLMQPDACIEEIGGSVQWVCWCMALFYWGVPLSRLGMWMGVHKVTVWRWMVSLVNELYESVAEQVRSRMHLSIIYIDEKWIKIRGCWHYWFVVLDAATLIPVVSYLATSRSAWTCRWIGLLVKQMKGKVKAVVSDGLASYVHFLPGVRHLLCHFHHQKGVTTWLKAHLSDSPHLEQIKGQLKRLLQTSDKRTVERRLTKLEQKASEWGIQGWVEKTRADLDKLLPAVGSRILPTTTNAIERFFRQFNRFYKVRRGFHSVDSAKEQLALFLIGYLFSKRASDGLAPIEAIWPEAAQTPLYRLLNDPFALHRRLANVKPSPKMADHPASDLLVAG